MPSKNNKIFDAVIERVSVDVMDMLRPQKLPFKELLHNISVLSDLLSIDVYLFVAMRRKIELLESLIRKLWKVNLGETRSRAVVALAPFDLIQWAIELFGTAWADNDESSFRTCRLPSRFPFIVFAPIRWSLHQHLASLRAKSSSRLNSAYFFSAVGT